MAHASKDVDQSSQRIVPAMPRCPRMAPAAPSSSCRRAWPGQCTPPRLAPTSKPCRTLTSAPISAGRWEHGETPRCPGQLDATGRRPHTASHDKFAACFRRAQRSKIPPNLQTPGLAVPPLDPVYVGPGRVDWPEAAMEPSLWKATGALEGEMAFQSQAHTCTSNTCKMPSLEMGSPRGLLPQRVPAMHGPLALVVCL
jgi:hypothetical protein